MTNRVEAWAIKIRNHPKVRGLPVWNSLRASYALGLRLLSLNRGLSRELYPGVVVKVSYDSRHALPADYAATLLLDIPSLALVKKYLAQKPVPCFVDIGANHGQFSMVVSRWLPAEASFPRGIVAFEPHPQNAKILIDNLRTNGCLKNTRVVPVALGAQPGQMTLYGESTTASLQREGEQDHRPRHLVEVQTLDAFCNLRKVVPDIIKIDVEGFELDVLRGATETLRALQKTIKIICEMHTFMWPRPDYGGELIKLVRSCGLNVFTIQGAPVEVIDTYGHYVIAQSFE